MARTLYDCSPFVNPPRLGWIIDDAERRKLLRLDALRECNARLDVGRGRRASAVMAELLAERAPGRDPGDSGWELWVRKVLIGAGLPEPVQQHRVWIGKEHFDLDLAYPEALVDLEYDGWDTHKGFHAFHRDRRRRRLLVANGWRVIEITSRTSASEVVDTTSQLLELAGLVRPNN